MVHPSSLGKWFEDRKGQALNLRVGLLDKVMFEDNVHLLRTHRPAIHANLPPDRCQIVQVGTGPTSKDVARLFVI